jgi:hypothetical protein
MNEKNQLQIKDKLSYAEPEITHLEFQDDIITGSPVFDEGEWDIE